MNSPAPGAETSVLTPELRDRLFSWRAEPMRFEVEKGAIRRYSETFGNSPMSQADVEESHNGTLVAMPTFLTYFNPFHWGVQRPLPEFPVAASAGDAFEFYRPVRSGDVITVTVRCVDIFEKRGASGQLLFTVDERLYTDQHGELIGKSNWTALRRVGASRRGQTEPSRIPEPPPRLFDYLRGDRSDGHAEAAAPFRRSEQIHFDDIAAGDALPSFKRTLTHDLFVRYAACNNEFARHHVDYLYAVAAGWKDCIAQGSLGIGFLCLLTAGWAGRSGSLRALKGSYRKPSTPGAIWELTGKVSKKYQAGGENRIDCDVAIVDQDGAVVTSGAATLALPSR
jgi:acyl dehydratase